MLFYPWYEHHWTDWLLVAISCTVLLLWIIYWLFHLMGLSRVLYKFSGRKGHLQPREEPWPGVSILKPLVGTDAYLAANLDSFFNMNYPLYELLFCVQYENDACIPLVEELIARNPAVDTRIFIGGKKVGANPKINNMQPAYEAAKYDLIMVSDSCIRMKEDALLDMVHCMSERVGLVYQMPYIGDPMSGFVSVLEKVHFGTFNARVSMTADLLGINCTTGMSVLMRKRPLDEAGGLRVFGRYLAEDYFMAQAVQERGYQLTLSNMPAMQMKDTKEVANFQARLMRWCKLRIAMVPLTTALEPLTECMLLGLMAALSTRYLLQTDIIVFFLLHVLCWFLFDWLIISRVQKPQTRPVTSQAVPVCDVTTGRRAGNDRYDVPPLGPVPTPHYYNGTTQSLMGRQAPNQQPTRPRPDTQNGPLPFSKFEFVVAWLVRELMAPVIFARALYDQRIEWRSSAFRLRWGGVAEEVPHSSCSQLSSSCSAVAPVLCSPSSAVLSATPAPPHDDKHKVKL